MMWVQATGSWSFLVRRYPVGAAGSEVSSSWSVPEYSTRWGRGRRGGFLAWWLELLKGMVCGSQDDLFWSSFVGQLEPRHVVARKSWDTLCRCQARQLEQKQSQAKEFHACCAVAPWQGGSILGGCLPGAPGFSVQEAPCGVI